MSDNLSDETATHFGKVYLLVAKYDPEDKKEWSLPDSVFALSRQGEDKISYHTIKDMFKRNGFWFITKKCYTMEEEPFFCSGEEIMSVVDNWGIVGRPKINITDRIVSFSEIASLAYENGVLTDEKGLKTIEKLNTVPSNDTEDINPSELLKSVQGKSALVSKQPFSKVLI